MNGRFPTATYRVQLTGEFGFRQCASVLPYLSSLGITTLYCSPVLQARTGSTHGYDTVDPTRLSLDLGGEEGWAALLAEARRLGMTLLLDIVPNHMAATTANPWWRDVLEHGRVSPCADMFDIDWESASARLRNRILLPVLTSSLGEAISLRKLMVDLAESGLVLRYETLEFPLDVRSYRLLLAPLLRLPPGTVSERLSRLVRTLPSLTKVQDMPGPSPDMQYALRNEFKGTVLTALSVLSTTPQAEGPSLRAIVRDTVRNLPPQQMRRLLREQPYVLEHWRRARHTINYRRFFDINDLAGVRVEDDRVFDSTHATLARMAKCGVVCGFRVDHVDGLRQPLRYLKRLQTIKVSSATDAVEHAPYIVVEKILSGDEVLPRDWPVQGTSGYDFLSEVAGLFVSPSGLADMQRHHLKTTETRATRARLTHDNKRRVLTQLFRADLTRLAHRLAPVAHWLYPGTDIATSYMVGALANATASLPVYRTYYTGSGPISGTDRRFIDSALEEAAAQPGARRYAPAGEVVRRALTLDIPETAPATVRGTAREHLLRWQQLTGAAMAKGFEDTTLYQDSVLLALNDVGGDHTLHATSLPHFHNWNSERRRTWPHTMNCTATHDTKRGEDVRARLAVLSEMPDVWSAAVDRWLASLASDTRTAPLVERVDAATHIFLLQTVVGAWPESRDEGDYARRLTEYMMKAAREAKTHSSWLEPNEDYERALIQLVSFMLGGEGRRLFHECFDTVIGAVCYHGLVNSVAQVLLKATCPGLPDFYQGTELPDLSLVDPDNRRPVDYAIRRSLLSELTSPDQNRRSMVAALVKDWPDAKAKIYVTARTLHLRAAYSDLFAKGDYTPLPVAGTKQASVCAYMRSLAGSSIIVVAPLGSRILAGHGRLPLGEAAWGAQAIALPRTAPESYEDALTGEQLSATAGHLALSRVFKYFPVALLVSNSSRRNSAGPD